MSAFRSVLLVDLIHPLEISWGTRTPAGIRQVSESEAHGDGTHTPRTVPDECVKPRCDGSDAHAVQ